MAADAGDGFTALRGGGDCERRKGRGGCAAGGSNDAGNGAGGGRLDRFMTRSSVVGKRRTLLWL